MADALDANMLPSVPVDWRTVDVVLSIAMVAVTPDFEDSRAMVSATEVEDEGSVIWLELV